MQEERRATIRHRTLKGARIAINDGYSTFECVVRNLSSAGALLKVTSIVGVPDSFQLVMSDGQQYACTVVRKTANEIAVTFD